MAFVKISEQPSLYNDLEKMSAHELLVNINKEDHKVPDAVEKAIPQIEKLVVGIVERMKKSIQMTKDFASFKNYLMNE